MDFFIGFYGQFAREPVQKKPILWSDRPEGLPPPQLYGPCFVNFFKGHFLSVLEPICYVQARKNNKIAHVCLFRCSNQKKTIKRNKYICKKGWVFEGMNFTEFVAFLKSWNTSCPGRGWEEMVWDGNVGLGERALMIWMAPWWVG